jgi:hypothetical protein
MVLSVIYIVFQLVDFRRQTTQQDYLYYQSSYGFLGIGNNAQYEIGSIQNNHKYRKKSSGVVQFSEYNRMDDSIYLPRYIGCSVMVFSREGAKSELNYCKLNKNKLHYDVISIFFDKNDYKYLLLDNGVNYHSIIAIFNNKQKLIKVINSDFDIFSLAVVNDKLVYAKSRTDGFDIYDSYYLTVRDLKTDKEVTYNYDKKIKNLDYITALLPLDNYYLIAYKGNDDYNYIVTSKGKLISKSSNIVSSYNSSYQIDGKWYLNALINKDLEDGDSMLVEYTEDSFKLIDYLKKCDRYNSLMFNNKSVYCIDKKDNKKIISVLDNDRNVYKLDKKYEYGAYHGLALFGFK